MITIKTSEEIKIMTEGGKILAKIIKELEKMVEPGITTKELDGLAESLIFKSGGECSFKGYQNFPSCLCTSLNEELVHVAPSRRKIKEGDIVSLDLGIKYGGYHTDMAITMPVSRVDPAAARLIRIAKKALEIGIKEAKPGNRFGDISFATQKHVESRGFNVVRDLCGHGIGQDLHEDPQILNYGERGSGPELVEGMVFCLEPMVTLGNWRLKKTNDGHGFETEDGSLSAHFEHTIALVRDGAKILTML